MVVDCSDKPRIVRGVVNKGLTRQLEIVMNKIRYYTPIDDLVGVKDPILLPYLVAELLSLAMRGQPISKAAQLNVYYPYWTGEKQMTLNNDRNGIPYLVTGCVLKDGNGLPSKMVELLLKGSEDAKDIFAKLELTLNRPDLSGVIVFSPVPFVDGKPKFRRDIHLEYFVATAISMQKCYPIWRFHDFFREVVKLTSCSDDEINCAFNEMVTLGLVSVTSRNEVGSPEKCVTEVVAERFEDIFGVKLPADAKPSDSPRKWKDPIYPFK